MPNSFQIFHFISFGPISAALAELKVIVFYSFPKINIIPIIRNNHVRTHLKCLYSHQYKCLVYDGFYHHGLDINIDADHYV